MHPTDWCPHHGRTPRRGQDTTATPSPLQTERGRWPAAHQEADNTEGVFSASPPRTHRIVTRMCHLGWPAFRRRTERRRYLLVPQSQEFTHGVSGDKDSAADMHGPEIAPPHQFIGQASPTVYVRRSDINRLLSVGELVAWLAISRRVSNEGTPGVDGG